ncbi:type II toxin-antitoxin system VapC family toxin [Brucella sp. IR073]|uniref:type II toxin-antitoxin system VapC family toxin n=1 Tax=unclassified Brucella TaxID=2632610 RepID=UPI003B984F49
MEVFQRLYFDTNIFIGLGEEIGARQQVLNAITALRMKNGRPFICTSELTLAELLVRPLREKDEAMVRFYENWITPDSAWLDVRPVTRNVLWSAALVRRDYPRVKLPDAIHLATAIDFKCSHFLTADKKVPDQVHVATDHLGYSRPSPILTVIEPTPNILQSILSDRA